jgi:hypothetical protein
MVGLSLSSCSSSLATRPPPLSAYYLTLTVAKGPFNFVKKSATYAPFALPGILAGAAIWKVCMFPESLKFLREYSTCYYQVFLPPSKPHSCKIRARSDFSMVVQYTSEIYEGQGRKNPKDFEHEQ